KKNIRIGSDELDAVAIAFKNGGICNLIKRLGSKPWIRNFRNGGGSIFAQVVSRQIYYGIYDPPGKCRSCASSQGGKYIPTAQKINVTEEYIISLNMRQRRITGKGGGVNALIWYVR